MQKITFASHGRNIFFSDTFQMLALFFSFGDFRGEALPVFLIINVKSLFWLHWQEILPNSQILYGFISHLPYPSRILTSLNKNDLRRFEMKIQYVKK